ncbi:MAG: oligosaccharide flippase family protein [Thalassotalea sp.]|nr:oligosaccharide flippase family protein [Thalassotalea sp.]
MKLFETSRTHLHSLMGLLSNATWLLSAEVVAKASRIITIVVLAAQLSPTSYGTAMLALAFHDVFGLILRAGVGSQIINCEPEKLESYAKNGILIQWGICLTIAIGQFSSADYLASLYDNEAISTLLKIMVVIYLLYPWVSIKIFLLQRQNKMRWFSVRNGICIIIENLTIAISAIFGADILAVAIGKIAFSIFWLLLFSFSPVISYGVGFCVPTIKIMLKTSGKLFNTEFFRGLRVHADTFVAGKLLTPELFGFYTFAKNAGVGLSQSLSQVYISALYPYLCKLRREGQLSVHLKKLGILSVMMSFMFVVQALIVPYYVPFIFDEKWAVTLPVISILCLAALPNFIIDSFCCLLRVNEQYHRETIARFTCLFISLISLYLFNPEDPMAFAVLILVSSLLCLLTLYFINAFIHIVHFITSLFNRRKPHEN